MRKPTPKQKMPEQEIADILRTMSGDIFSNGLGANTNLGVIANHSKDIHLVLVAIFAQLVALEKRLADPTADTTQDFAKDAIERIVALSDHPQFTST